MNSKLFLEAADNANRLCKCGLHSRLTIPTACENGQAVGIVSRLCKPHLHRRLALSAACVNGTIYTGG